MPPRPEDPLEPDAADDAGRPPASDPDVTGPDAADDGPDARDAARDEPGAGVLDERWAQIVAQLHDLDGDGDGWIVGPRARARPARVVRAAQPPTGERQDSSAGGPPSTSGRDWDGTAQYDEAEDAVDALEHFVPPEPAPVLGGNPLLTLAWTLVVGVPVLFVVMLIAWRHPPGWLPSIAGVAFVVALAVLIWRMPHRRDEADHDSGAVV